MGFVRAGRLTMLWRRCATNLAKGFVAVYDADLSGYFDSIPHDKLMKCLEMRISDRSVLKLIRLWLNAAVVESDDDGKPKMSRSDGKGTPQGGVISPLLANIYLHCLDRRFHGPSGPARWANARLIRYADDFVILAQVSGSAAYGLGGGASGELAWSASESGEDTHS